MTAIVGVLNKHAVAIAADYMCTIISSLDSQTKMEGTLLIREQVEDISTRISEKVSENVTRQLEKAMSLAIFDKSDKV